MERFQIGRLQLGDGLLGAERIKSVADVAEKCAAHGEAGALEEFIFARLDAGDLDFHFAFQFIGGENWIQNYVGQ